MRDEASGLSASELGLRRSLWQNEAAVASVQLTALIPGQGENVSNLPLGDGDGAWEIRALWGQRLLQRQFADIQLAHRWRGGRDLDEMRLDLTWGWQPADRWRVLVQSFSVWSVESALPGAPEFDQHKLQLSVGREFNGAEYHAGVLLTPAGRNSIEERGVFLSVWRRF